MLRKRRAERADLNRCIFVLSSSHHLMRVFGSIVHPRPLLIQASQSQTPERRGVGAQLVGDHQFGGEALLLEQLRLVAPTQLYTHCVSDAERSVVSMFQLPRRSPQRCSRRAITGPNLSTQHRTVS